jgi:hypothetical protein
LLAAALCPVLEEISELDARIRRIDRELAALAKRDDVAQRGCHESTGLRSRHKADNKVELQARCIDRPAGCGSHDGAKP